jgi:hypothetical protein
VTLGGMIVLLWTPQSGQHPLHPRDTRLAKPGRPSICDLNPPALFSGLLPGNLTRSASPSIAGLKPAIVTGFYRRRKERNTRERGSEPPGGEYAWPDMRKPVTSVVLRCLWGTVRSRSPLGSEKDFDRLNVTSKANWRLFRFVRHHRIPSARLQCLARYP